MEQRIIHRTRSGPMVHSMVHRMLLVLLLAPLVGSALGQCTNATAFGTAAAPTNGTAVTISTCTFQSEYNIITGVVAGATYQVTSSCGGYITVRRGTFNGVVVANGNAPLTFVAPVADTYFLHFNTNAACGTASTCCTTTITCTSCGAPTGCVNATAFGTVAAPTNSTPVTISTCTYQTEYNTITGAVAGATYQLNSSCGGYITVRQNTFNGPVTAQGNAPLTFTAPAAGTYFVHYNTNAACGTAALCCTTTITCTSCSGTIGCVNTIAFGTVAAPTNSTPLTISTCNYQNEYNTITGVVAGSTYQINSSCGGYVTVRQTTFNGPVVTQGNAPLTFTAPANGTYFIHYNTNAACGTASVCCTTTITCTSCTGGGGGCTNYILQVTGGSFPAEVSWALVSNTAVVATGAAPITTTVCLVPGCYTMQLFDSFGDGWNGAAWTLLTSGGVLVQTGTLATGFGANVTVPVGVPAGNCGGTGPVTASDCPQAVNVCTDISFQIDPNGYGNVSEIPPLGSLGNPDLLSGDFAYSTWGTDNFGCLRNNELNSTWMVVNIQTGGSLEFTFGGLGTQAGFYDWIMYPFTNNTCGQISGNTVPPVRCNWNGVSTGGTGLASTIPPGGNPSNFEPPLMVNTGDLFIICFSNWSSVTTTVPLVFGGTAVVSCTPIILPVELVALSATPQTSHIAVEWTTASETNTLRYELQRSPDDLTWTTVAELPAAGHSSLAHTTRWNDHAPLPGDNYYRLVVHDADGEAYTSSEVHAFWKVERPVALPNPNDGRFRITVAAPEDVLGVVDPTGRPVRYRLEGDVGALYVVLDEAAVGLYTVRIAQSDGPISIPVMVQGH